MFTWLKSVSRTHNIYKQLNTCNRPFTELLERWPYDGFLGDDAVSTYTNIGQITSNHAVSHNNGLHMETIT